VGIGIVEMRDIILDDYYAWYVDGKRTGKWRQEGVIFQRSVAGCGKTEIMFQIGEILKAGFKDLPPLPQAFPPVQLFFNAAMDVESIAGTPAPSKLKVRKINLSFNDKMPETLDNPRFIETILPTLTMHFREELIRPLQGDPGAILFLDEEGRDAPHMRAPKLKLLSPEKTLAGLDMSHFYITCAGNPADENHRVDDIMADVAMASRLIPFNVDPRVPDWVDYMYKRGPTHIEVANFILDNPSMFIGHDSEDDPSSAFHCPRSWTICASRLHAHGGGTDKQAAKAVTQAAIGMVHGSIGPRAGHQLMAYLNKNRPMNLQAILNGRFEVDSQTKRIRDGVTPSAVRNLQEHLQKEDLTDAQADNVAAFMKAIPADIAHSINRNNRLIRPLNLAKLAQRQAISDIIARVKKIEQFAKNNK
jgi:hypothetical protein